MPQSAKIATCCYCGSRTTLVLDAGLHELTCGSCGAPLHDMKRLRSDAKGKKSKKVKPPKRPKAPKDPWAALAHEVLGEVSRHGRRKAKRSLTRSIFKELKDILD